MLTIAQIRKQWPVLVWITDEVIQFIQQDACKAPTLQEPKPLPGHCTFAGCHAVATLRIKAKTLGWLPVCEPCFKKHVKQFGKCRGVVLRLGSKKKVILGVDTKGRSSLNSHL